MNVGNAAKIVLGVGALGLTALALTACTNKSENVDATAIDYMSKYDKNNDGKLSLEKLPGARGWFQNEYTRNDAQVGGSLLEDDKISVSSQSYSIHPLMIKSDTMGNNDRAVTLEELKAGIGSYDKNTDGMIDDAESKAWRGEKMREHMTNASYNEF
jgi:Ca2+-binding EF-hand superfamily protein